ncbi:MAG: hypothetical protein ABIJ23_01565 [Candidatus Magasanikbacteria bacterium]
MSYLKWKEQIISNFSPENINSLYDQGFLFGRNGKGAMYQTRSLRIDLSKFELSSENRRILRKTESIKLEIEKLPMKNYHWSIGKLAKDFYDKKFGDGTFSANKIKELLTDKEKSNFNRVFIYALKIGYCICLETDEIIHYSYPFYANNNTGGPTGMMMMTKAVDYAKESNKQYIYLGSAKDAKAKYKLQFKGLEWFDGKKWSEDLDELKNILK